MADGSPYFQIIWNVLREPTQRALQELVMERQTQGKVEFPPFMQKIVDRSRIEGCSVPLLADPLLTSRPALA